jgi:hypothetical protein
MSFTGAVSDHSSWRNRSAFMKSTSLVFISTWWTLLSAVLAQPAGPASMPKQLTIEQIFADGGVTGRAPETIKWSPDGTKVSFVQRDDTGEHGELWYVDALTGDKKILVSEIKLSQLAPPAQQDSRRARERARGSVPRRRLHLVARFQAPALRFAGTTLVLQPGYRNGSAAYVVSGPERGPEVFAGRQAARLRAQAQPVCASGLGRRRRTPAHSRREREKTRTRDKDKEDNILNGEVDWVYAEELEVRSNFFWSPEGKATSFFCRWMRLACRPIRSPTGCRRILGSSRRNIQRREILIPACAWESSAAMVASRAGSSSPMTMTPMCRASAGFAKAGLGPRS